MKISIWRITQHTSISTDDYIVNTDNPQFHFSVLIVTIHPVQIQQFNMTDDVILVEIVFSHVFDFLREKTS
jgi:hypothetical protein